MWNPTKLKGANKANLRWAKFTGFYTSQVVVWDFFHQPYIRHFFSHTSAAFGGGGFFFADSLPRCWGIVMCWSTYLGINTLKQTTFFPHKKKTTLPETNSKFAPENRPGLPKRKQSYSNHIPTHQGEENTYSSHQGVDNPFFWGVSKYIYIYMVPPPQDPYFLRIYWYLRYFVVFYYV